jgi:hypothetical protein
MADAEKEAESAEIGSHAENAEQRRYAEKNVPQMR